MLPAHVAPRILAWRHPVDMRKSFDGLVGMVRDAMREDPLSGTLFIFVNRRDNYLKLIPGGGEGGRPPERLVEFGLRTENIRQGGRP